MSVFRVNWSSVVNHSSTTSDVLSILIPLINKDNGFVTHFLKLQTSHFKTKKNKSLMKMLNNSGPRIDS